jgi:hypothetical protein
VPAVKRIKFTTPMSRARRRFAVGVGLLWILIPTFNAVLNGRDDGMRGWMWMNCGQALLGVLYLAMVYFSPVQEDISRE